MRHVDSELQKAMDGDGTVESGDKYFFDWSDPATGLPINSRRGPSILVDNDLLERFFSFNSVYVCVGGGGCRMIEHPKLGLNVYPASGIICVANDDLPLLTDVLTRLSVTS
ncbi:hypothetical protein AGDE_05398 [Angomonas deanei]|uniref:Uncharacterized protein n=1 Tax=Angomonas deanei TaxID=59799 RepID=S9VHK0_9TRYP|nr:hypothetical protein AGDE_11193 [Angomonas deanei]EPY38531.1 hypothetical protein AGDE_05398 [Angomonas deanei]CAD2218054.1 hypothetical protein, conserved [Angomonas deanei]|eukprot:EPY26586.1 hypothetical protein AGDE_11193 [Angomonas deanei]